MSAATAAPAPGGHPIPTLAEPSAPEPPAAGTAPRATTEGDERKKKRSLFGFGKKKADEQTKAAPSKSAPATTTTSTPAATSTTTTTTTTTTTPAKTTTTKTTSSTMNRTTPAAPIRTDRAAYPPSSPGTRALTSPHLASPSGSQIFERNVQESASSLLPSSPAIPSHIQTENYIPPVLDASSSAITDDHLTPDTVEIITHPSHQPASVTVAGSIHSPLYSPALSAPEPSWADELAAFSATRGASTLDTASNYGSFDTTDVRRLSFISFADVVQAEQALFPGSGVAGSRESMHLAGLTSLASMGSPTARGRSPSPIRSPVSSASVGLGSSSPASRGGSVKGGLEGGGGWAKPMGSPTSLGGSMHLPPPQQQHGTVSGEIAIETMSQALRRTGSGELGAGGGGTGRVGSFPTSPV